MRPEPLAQVRAVHHVAEETWDISCVTLESEAPQFFKEGCRIYLLLSWNDISSAAEGQGQLTGEAIIEIASMKAKLFLAFSRTNKGDAGRRGIETPCHCS